MFFAMGMKCEYALVISDSIVSKLLKRWNLKGRKLAFICNLQKQASSMSGRARII